MKKSMMKTIKQNISKVISRGGPLALAVMLAVAFVVAAVPQMQVQAAVQKASYTFYTGQTGSFTNYYEVRSVKSSKPAVIQAKKNPERNYRTDLTAKKPGSATVTIKTIRNTIKLKIKVVKPDLSAEVVNVSQDTGCVIYKVTNASNLTYERVNLQYTLRNSDNEVKEESTTSVSTILPKSYTYVSVSYNRSAYDVDGTRSSGTVITTGDKSPFYSPDYKYANAAKKLTVSEEPGDGKLAVTFKNTSGTTINGYIVYIFYDADGNIIDVTSRSVNVSAKETSTSNVITSYKGYDHYEKLVNVYQKTKKD